MSVETVLVKRHALYKGEVGFFPSSTTAEEDIAAAQMNEELLCQFTSPRTLQQLKYLWALVQKTAENSDAFVDKDEAMAKLKIAVGHSRLVYDIGTKSMEVRPKSLRRLGYEKLRKLTDNMIDYICREIIPGMDENALRKEIESMIAPLPSERPRVGRKIFSRP